MMDVMGRDPTLCLNAQLHNWVFLQEPEYFTGENILGYVVTCKGGNATCSICNEAAYRIITDENQTML
jgi:hypothetical protein